VADPGSIMDPPVERAERSVDPKIMAALLRLSTRQRQVVALRVFLDLNTDRTADVLGIAPGTVQAHLGRAIATLRHELVPQPRPEGLPS